MGVFFRSESLEPLVVDKLANAFASDRSEISEARQTAEQEAKEVNDHGGRFRGDDYWSPSGFSR